jgi:hypothetical protein
MAYLWGIGEEPMWYGGLWGRWIRGGDWRGAPREKKRRDNAEALRAQRFAEKRKSVALDRKSPPLETKGGAPSRTCGVRITGKDQEC